MNILETIGGAQNGVAVNQLANQFGLQPAQAQAAIAALVPALAAGFQNNMSTEGGLSGLAAAVSSGRHEAYLDNPQALANPATVADGNGILGHVFGDKEVSRQVATAASRKTGIDPSILKKMLPVVAAMVMAGLARQARARTGGVVTPGAVKGGLSAILGPMLDKNHDGSMVDDVAGMVGGMLSGRRRT
jgi:hypothetical protein